MWFSSRYRELGSIDISVAKQVILNLDESKWYEDEQEKALFAGDRPTQSIFLRYIKPQVFAEKVKRAPIKNDDIYVSDKHAELQKALEPLISYATSFFSVGGIVAKVQLARMLPGSTIESHYDSYPLLFASHRLHIPLVTHDKLRFVVDDEKITMNEGCLYELNNQLVHSVANPSSASLRIHLIVDFLPPENNSIEALSNRFEFNIRTRIAEPPNKVKLGNVDLPTVIATSVVRGAHKSESHGGVYLVDLKNGRSDQVVDWDNCDIDFSGRGWDRGLRGVCIVGKRIFIAATDAIYEFDHSFKIINKFSNQYLRHAHEMVFEGGYIYVTSTGFDSVLRFDLKKSVYDKGFYLNAVGGSITCEIFDLQSNKGPEAANKLHVNNVSVKNGELFISGRQLGNLVRIRKKGSVEYLYRIPPGTHNVTSLGKGKVLYNDSESDQLVCSSNYDYRYFPVPYYEEQTLLNRSLGDDIVARQAFARGLCTYKNGIVIAGSSPSTITAYNLKDKTIVKSFNISMDVRNSIHGLEIWPF